MKKKILICAAVVLLASAGTMFFWPDKAEKTLNATAPVSVAQNESLLSEKGVSVASLEAAQSLKTTDGACGSRGVYSKYYYDQAGFMSVTNETKGGFTCTTYDINVLKNYSGDTTARIAGATSEIKANTNGTSTKVSTSGNQKTVTVTDERGVVYSSTGTNVNEKCFGPGNTVCTQLTVDESMITTCLLTPRGDGFYTLGGNLGATWYYSTDPTHMNPYQCSNAPSFHVQFYDK